MSRKKEEYNEIQYHQVGKAAADLYESGDLYGDLDASVVEIKMYIDKRLELKDPNYTVSVSRDQIDAIYQSMFPEENIINEEDKANFQRIKEEQKQRSENIKKQHSLASAEAIKLARSDPNHNKIVVKLLEIAEDNGGCDDFLQKLTPEARNSIVIELREFF